MDKFIKVDNLTYKNIFNNINMTIVKSTFISISGPNKCGKSTLLRILSGQLPLKSTVYLNNDDITRFSKNNLYKDIAYVNINETEEFIFPTVEKELLFILDNLGLKQTIRIRRYKEIIKVLNLEEITQKDPAYLTGKEKIFFVLAQAIIYKPKLLVLDDIFIGLRKNEVLKVIKVLKALTKSYKMTIIISLDDLYYSLYTDYLYILDKGKILLEGIPIEVLKKDNVLNKIGLQIPFMIDLSVKLKDYNLIDDTILNMDKMVNLLWK